MTREKIEQAAKKYGVDVIACEFAIDQINAALEEAATQERSFCKTPNDPYSLCEPCRTANRIRALKIKEHP